MTVIEIAVRYVGPLEVEETEAAGSVAEVALGK
jgi:hypothetical protein